MRGSIVGGWSKRRELGLGLVEMGEARDEVCGAGLLCQWAVALIWPRDEGGYKRKGRGSLVLAKMPGA